MQSLRNALESGFVGKPFVTYPQELWSRRTLPSWLSTVDCVPVENIGGCLMSLRSAPAKECLFDETLGYGIGYALHEDMELSLRLQNRGYLLIGSHRARIYHDEHPDRRAGGFNYGFLWIANYIYACRRNIPETASAWQRDLPRFMRYKLALYSARALVRRDEHSRDIARASGRHASSEPHS